MTTHNNTECCEKCKPWQEAESSLRFARVLCEVCSCHHQKDTAYHVGQSVKTAMNRANDKQVKESSEEWEEKFDETFDYRAFSKDPVILMDVNKVKSFIRFLLSEVAQREREKCRKEFEPLVGTFELKKLQERFEDGRTEERERIVKIAEGMKKETPGMHRPCTKALTDLISRITTHPKEV